MNLLINTYLTPSPLGAVFSRGILPGPDDKLDIFKFMLNSLAAMQCWTGSVDIYCLLDSAYHHRYDELHSHVLEHFPTAKIYNYRNTTIQQWREATEHLIQPEAEQVTFLSTNHDHIFTGKLSVVSSIEQELSTDREIRCRQVYASHWGELLGWAYFNLHHQYDKFVSFLMPSKDGIQILNKESVKRWFFENTYEHQFGRTDGLHDSSIEPIEILMPLEECCRHYDGYNTPGIYPAMIIPCGLFDGKDRVIKYGYKHYESGYVNINSVRNYRDIDATGTDYSNCLLDMPSLFKYNKYAIDISGDAKESYQLLIDGRIHAIQRILEYNLTRKKMEYNHDKSIDPHFINEISRYAITM